MERFTYTWRDFGLAYRFAMEPRRILLSCLLVIWSFVAAWAVSCFTAWQVLPAMPLAQRGLLPEVAQIPFLVLLALGWWWGVTRLALALLRGAAIELCADKRATLTEVFAYVRGYGRFVSRAPLGLVMLGSPFLLGALVYAGLCAIPGAGAWIGAILAPFAVVGAGVLVLVGGLGVGTLPMQAVSIAVHGGDTYEGISRAMMYGSMSPQRYVFWFLVKVVSTAIALALVGVVLALACLTMASAAAGFQGGLPAIQALIEVMLGRASADTNPALVSPVLATGMQVGAGFGALLALAYGVSYATSADVIVFLLVRHRCDGTPVTEMFLPRDAVYRKATLMEQEQAAQAIPRLKAAATETPTPVVLPQVPELPSAQAPTPVQQPQN